VYDHPPLYMWHAFRPKKAGRTRAVVEMVAEGGRPSYLYVARVSYLTCKLNALSLGWVDVKRSLGEVPKGVLLNIAVKEIFSSLLY
jgi:hypothetical protein